MDYIRIGVSSDVMTILPWTITPARVQKIKFFFKNPASIKGLLTSKINKWAKTKHHGGRVCITVKDKVITWTLTWIGHMEAIQIFYFI